MIESRKQHPSKIYRLLAILIHTVLIFFLLNQNITGQTEIVPVEKTQEKVILQGKVYYLHAVKKGQTLYSISRAYGVTQQEISTANSDTKLNILSNGQVLKIPVKGEAGESSNSQIELKEGDFIYHTIQPKQTAYYLHQKYNVSVDAIYRFNPGTENGFQIGQVIRIPKSQFLTEIHDTLNLEPYNQGIKYEVQTGDTLYNLANRYGISVSEIINANEELRWGLKVGQIITIPLPDTGHHLSKISPFDSTFNTYQFNLLNRKSCDSIALYQTTKAIKVALLLPLFVSETFEEDTAQFNDSIDDVDTRAKTSGYKGLGAIEFYEGVLLALDSLKNEGRNIQLYTYDTEADTNKLKTILKELDSVKPNLILGTFAQEDVRIVSKYSLKKGIPFVPPLMKDDTLSKQNPYLFQSTPSFASELNLSAQYISQFYNQNIILLYNPSLARKPEIDQFKSVLFDHFSSQSVYDSAIFKEIPISKEMITNLRLALKPNSTNIIIVTTSQEPEVSRIISQLFPLSKYYTIQVFGMPSWQKFKNVRIEQLHELQLTLYSPFYIDYNKPETKRIVATCRNKLGYEPFKTTSKGTGLNFTYYGYDIGYYFIKLIGLYGSQASMCSGYFHPDLILSDYYFERNPAMGCMENNSINLIRYNKDLTIESIPLKSK